MSEPAVRPPALRPDQTSAATPGEARNEHGQTIGAALQHLDYLDGWRGLAIVFLLIGHFFPYPGINFGTVGVNLFFVLSGLLMSRLLFVKSVPIPTFYRRRISRIFPAFFVMLTVVTLGWALAGNAIEWREVAGAGFFINNYTLHGVSVMPLGHIWSLSVEEHSYIALSLIAVLARWRRCSPLAMIAACTALFAATGVWYWTHFSGRELVFGLWGHSEVSAYGIFLSAFFMLALKDRTLPSLPWMVYPGLVAAGIALHWWSMPEPVHTFLGVGLFALTVNLLSAAPMPVKSMLSLRPLRQMGIWSFSIYLWQQPFYLALHRTGMPAWLALGCAIATGIASYYLIEQPMRRVLNSRWGNAPVALPQAVPD